MILFFDCLCLINSTDVKTTGNKTDIMINVDICIYQTLLCDNLFLIRSDNSRRSRGLWYIYRLRPFRPSDIAVPPKAKNTKKRSTIIFQSSPMKPMKVITTPYNRFPGLPAYRDHFRTPSRLTPDLDFVRHLTETSRHTFRSSALRSRYCCAVTTTIMSLKEDRRVKS